MKKIIQYVNNANSILITTHFNPDGDAIGAMFALQEALISYDKEVFCCINKDIDVRYNLICDTHRNFPYKQYDLLIVVDCHNTDRFYVDFTQYANNCICIDHHDRMSCDYQFDYIYNKHSSACCEWIYNLINLLHIEITPKIATLLYMGIRTDTSDFKNQNTSSNALNICSKLLDKKADISLINNIYNINSNVLKLLEIGLNTLLVDYKYKFVCMYIAKKDIECTNTNYEEARSLIEYIRNIDKIDVSLLFIEYKNRIMIRARSKVFDVNNLMQYFNGGGHKYASGGFIYEDYTQVIKKLKELS